MLAMQIINHGGPKSALRLADVDEPTRGADQVLIDVEAAGVSFPDLLQTRGRYQFRPDLPFIPGLELAGRVREAPEDSSFWPGQRVGALTMIGAWAETVAVAADSVFPLPDTVSWTTGAGLLDYLTMWLAYYGRGGLSEGETVLVHGAAGGIGEAAIRLARLVEARVVAVASSESKRAAALAAGAEEAIPLQDFLGRVKELTSGRGVDVIVDPVGGERFTDSLRALAPGGRLLVIGFAGGAIPTVKVNRLLLTNTAIVGVGYAEYVKGNRSYQAEIARDLLSCLHDGRLSVPDHSAWPLEQARDVLIRMDSRQLVGKAVLSLGWDRRDA